MYTYVRTVLMIRSDSYSERLIVAGLCGSECVRVWLLSSVNVLMQQGEKNENVISLSLISPPLLYPSIQMGTAWDERISLYWTWLNAVLMKAHADNSFFIMSLAGLGISFFPSQRERSSDFLCCRCWFGVGATSSSDWVSIVCLEYYFFYIAFLLD